ncbi:hypothetical protein ACG33_07770 [Steroidobacter denitrificans]|uniref:Endolytic murein transglycosylase n=2 Tax=Steroidobacter denitrificans TaxID=465721 RepID=A0A127F9A1_STEDE|nr:hypothetical protein ACG33_07770 [Steroidobacter denitrificans]
MRLLLRTLGALLLLALIAAAFLSAWSYQWLRSPIAGLQQATTIEVTKGSSLRAVAASLHAQGLLDQPYIWVAWARLAGDAQGIKAGEYLLQPGLTPAELLELLHSGQVVLHAVTFVEGSTFGDIRKVLLANPSIDTEYAHLPDERIMQALGVPELHPEGQFFPDTYHFARGTRDLDILAMAHRRLQQELEAAWRARAPDLPLAGAYEALILASIIEKETALDSERGRIAGVFLERLRRGMRLQTDPTVIYGMLEAYDGNLRRADLTRDTPYNTYTRAGLPPTPIAMPSLQSLHAAVQPEISNALFFVATGEGDGSHYFSATLAEHNEAVRRYLRRLRQR